MVPGPSLQQPDSAENDAYAVDGAGPGDADDDVGVAVLRGEDDARGVGEGFGEGEVLAHFFFLSELVAFFRRGLGVEGGKREWVWVELLLLLLAGETGTPQDRTSWVRLSGLV